MSKISEVPKRTARGVEVEWKNGRKKTVSVGYMVSETQKWVVITDTVQHLAKSKYYPHMLMNIPRKDIKAIRTLVPAA